MLGDSRYLYSGVVGAGGAITAQSITGLTAVASTNVVDHGLGFNNTPFNPGFAQDDMYIVVTTDAASGGTTPTLKIDVETATDAPFTTPIVVGSVQLGALKAGDSVVIPFPQDVKQFSRLRYTQTGTSPTNSVKAFLTSDPQQWVSTPDALIGSP